MTSSTKENVVIVGGGMAGIAIYNSLYSSLDASRFDLILISARDYSTHYPGAIRMVTSPQEELEDRVLLKFGPRFNKDNKKLIIGTVASIQERSDKTGGQLVLSDGSRVDWTFLVLATGSTWRGAVDLPLEKSDVKGHINSWKEKFERANDIVLVGGGVVGIEFAGEIKEFWPKKNVTIIHGSDSLLNPSYPKKFRDATTRRVSDLGINLILNDYLDTTKLSGELTTRYGKPIIADLIVQARGSTPNTDFIASSLGPDTLSASRLVKVLPTLQLSENHPHIFAAGDIIDRPEQKQAAKTIFHAPVVVKNVLSLSKGKKPTAKYNGTFEAVLISLGKSQGITYLGLLWGMIFGNWFTVPIKSKGLLIPKSNEL